MAAESRATPCPTDHSPLADDQEHWVSLTGRALPLLTTSDSPPVIIVMSDHGSRVEVTFGDLADPDKQERFKNLFAAFTPGHSNLFPDWITPVNVLPIILNAYAEGGLQCPPNDTYANGNRSLLDLHRIDNPDASADSGCDRGT